MNNIDYILRSMDKTIYEKLIKGGKRDESKLVKVKRLVTRGNSTFWQEFLINPDKVKHDDAVISGHENLDENHPAKHKPPAEPVTPKQKSKTKKQSTEATPKAGKYDDIDASDKVKAQLDKLTARERKAAIRALKNIGGTKHIFESVPDKENKAERASRSNVEIVNGYELTDETKHLVPFPEGSAIPEFMYKSGKSIPKSWINVMVSQDPTKKIWAIGTDENGDTQYVYSPEHTKEASEEKYNFIRKLQKIEENLLAAFNALDPNLYEGMSPSSDEYIMLNATKNALIFMYKTGVRVGSKCAKQKTSKGALEITYRNVSQETRRVVDENGNVSQETFYKIDFIGKDGIPQHIDVFDEETKVIISKCMESARKRHAEYAKQNPEYMEAHKNYQQQVAEYTRKVKAGLIKPSSSNAPKEPDILANCDTRLFPISYPALMVFMREKDITPKDLRTLYTTHITKQILGQPVDTFLRETGTPQRFLDGHNPNSTKVRLPDITEIKFPKPVSQLKPPPKNLEDAVQKVKAIENLDKQAEMFQGIMMGVAGNVSTMLGNFPQEAFKSYIDPQIFQEWQPELMDNWKRWRDQKEQAKLKKLADEYDKMKASGSVPAYPRGFVDVESVSAGQSPASTKTDTPAGQSPASTKTDTPAGQSPASTKTDTPAGQSPASKLYNKTAQYMKPIEEVGMPEGISSKRQEMLKKCKNVLISTDPQSNLLAKGIKPDGKPYYVYRKSYKQDRQETKTSVTEDLANASARFISTLGNYLNDPGKPLETKTVIQLLSLGVPFGGKNSPGIINLTKDNVVTVNGRTFITLDTKLGKWRTELDDATATSINQLVQNTKSGEKLFKTSSSTFRRVLGVANFAPNDFRSIRATTLARQLIQNTPSPKNAKEFMAQMNLICGQVGNAICCSRNQAKRTFIDQRVFREWNPQLYDSLTKGASKK